MPVVALSDNEKLVYEVVREYLNLNRIFEVEKFTSFIKARFRMASINITEEGIESLLYSLIKKNLLVEGSKLTGDNILDNKKRSVIYDIVFQNPGIYLKKIVDGLEISFNVVIWHLNILHKFEYIKKAHIENKVIYFDSKLNFNEVEIYYFTSNDRSRRIIEHLKLNDIGITKTQLSTDLNMHLNTISKLLGYLEEYNIITKENDAGKTLYFLNEKYGSITQ